MKCKIRTHTIKIIDENNNKKFVLQIKIILQKIFSFEYLYHNEIFKHCLEHTLTNYMCKQCIKKPKSIEINIWDFEQEDKSLIEIIIEPCYTSDIQQLYTALNEYFITLIKTSSLPSLIWDAWEKSLIFKKFEYVDEDANIYIGEEEE